MSGANDGSLSVGRIEFGSERPMRIFYGFDGRILYTNAPKPIIGPADEVAMARDVVIFCLGLSRLVTFSSGPPLPAISDGPCFDLSELRARNADAIRRKLG